MKKINLENKTDIVDPEIKELVLERLKTFPSGKRLSVGSDGDFTKEQLIKSVEQENKIGKRITEIQIEFLRSLKKGILLNE